MPESAICDQCNSTITDSGGYSFYSTAAIGMPGMARETGGMMLCESCTGRIITEENWRKHIPARREMTGADILANPMALFDQIQNANGDAIVKLCKRHGFTPDEARAKARELAQAWWVDPSNGEAAAATFWKTPPKKWWEFWK